GEYNFWAALMNAERSFPNDQIPQFPIKSSETLKGFIRKYGEPSSVGVFQTADKKQLRVHWYGPILLMADGEDAVCTAIGGWPSRLLTSASDFRGNKDESFPQPESWPARTGDLTGQMEVRVKNPNDFKVRVALRSD